jgi:hypothetical protein
MQLPLKIKQQVGNTFRDESCCGKCLFQKKFLPKETIRLIIFYGSNIKGWLGPATQRKVVNRHVFYLG